jgi:hypothetical protein
MFKSLKDVLPEMIDELGISEQLKRAAVFTAWRSIAADLPAHARAAAPFRYQRGILVVEAPSSAAVQELHMRAPQITRDLNRRLGRPLVTKLELRVRGRRSTPRGSAALPSQATSQGEPKAAPSDDPNERERRLRHAIDLIEDPKVRAQALARLAANDVPEEVRCAHCGVHVTTPGVCPLCQAHEVQESGE